MNLFEQELFPQDAALILTMFNGKQMTVDDFGPGFLANVGGCVIEQRDNLLLLVGPKEEVKYLFSSLVRHGCG